MSRKLLKIAGVFLALASFGLVGVQPSTAASKVTVDLPNEAVVGGESVPLPIFLTDFNVPDLTITLLVAEGTLTVEDTDGKLTLNPGYPSLAAQSEISFHGAAADVVSIAENSVTWTAPGDASTSASINLKIRVGEYVSGVTYNPGNGHVYKYISNNLTWYDARDAAAAMTYEGKNGYLATITSAEENTFVQSKTGAQNVWFGGTADAGAINAARAAKGLAALGYDPQPLGEYYWISSDDFGINFSTGLGFGRVNVGTNYHNWANGEPNNAAGNEGCAVTNWGGMNGLWNDLNCGGWNNPYLVEFDTSAADFETLFATWDNIDGVDVDVNPAVVEEEESELADTGYSAMMLFALAALLLVVGSYLRLVARKR